MDDDDLIPLSALQHFLYCPRQCALIHLERLWAESRETAEGRVLHDRVDKPLAERRRGVRSVTAMPLLEPTLGLIGVADLVEFHAGGQGETAFPVEFKRGRPKAHRADEVQLCAQALCLEAMLRSDVPVGALYYGKTRRRKEVRFDGALRSLTQSVIGETRAMLQAGRTPKAVYQARRCDACSLFELCQPRWLEHRESVTDWLSEQLESQG